MCCMPKKDLTSKGGQISISVRALDVAIEFFFSFMQFVSYCWLLLIHLFLSLQVIISDVKNSPACPALAT